jgi:hypothetical protein
MANRAAQRLGRLGGKAKAAKMTAAQRSKEMSMVVTARWAKTTEKERKAVGKMLRKAKQAKRKAK